MTLFYGIPLRRSGVGFSRRALALSSHQLASDIAQNMTKPTAPQVVRNMVAESILSDRLRHGDCFGFFLLVVLTGIFYVVYDIVDNRYCSHYDAQAAVEHQDYAAIVHEEDLGLCSCLFSDSSLSSSVSLN